MNTWILASPASACFDRSVPCTSNNARSTSVSFQEHPFAVAPGGDKKRWLYWEQHQFPGSLLAHVKIVVYEVFFVLCVFGKEFRDVCVAFALINQQQQQQQNARMLQRRALQCRFVALLGVQMQPHLVC